MFYVQLAPLGVILGYSQFKCYFCRQKHTKRAIATTDLAEHLCVEPQTPPGSKSKSWQMGNFWPKNIVDAGSEHSQMDQL